MAVHVEQHDQLLPPPLSGQQGHGLGEAVAAAATTSEETLCGYTPYSLGLMSLFAVFFTIVYNLSGPISWRLSSTYRALPPKLRLRWDNRVTSSVHALVVAPCALYTFLYAFDPQAISTSQGRILGCNDQAFVWVCFSAGYFAWDSLTYLLYVIARRTDDVGVAEFVHSFVCWFGYLMSMKPFVLYHGMYFLVYEVSTPFVNFHWFMDKCGVQNSNPFKALNGILLVVFFFLARIVFGFYYSYEIWRDLFIVLQDNISASGPWVINFGCVLISVIILVMVILNSYWFTLILSFVQKKPRAPQAKSE